jgi:redox-sensing transcriptional repressor
MLTNTKSVARLSRYRIALYRFKSFQSPWILSEQLAASLGITAAQVRKDFSVFGVTGKRKSGYNVDVLLEKLDALLGKNERNKAIIAGFGPLGKTLYREYFKKDMALEVMAAFDETASDPAGIDEETGLHVLPIEALVSYVARHRIPYGIIAAASGSAQRFLDRMVLAGIRGIVNFSAVELKIPKTCVIRDINPVRELENVIYFTRQHRTGKYAEHNEKLPDA